ncbi:MAG TPA: ABC transporter permease subunit [Dehalococcoidia bacterium]|nr:ABC transporter permease subunit [Dehalococcoidia bacterium]
MTVSENRRRIPSVGGAFALWRDIRFQRFAFQALFAALIFFAAYVLFTNTDRSLESLNLEPFPFIETKSSFPFIDVHKDFLGQRAGFGIDERAFGFDYSPNQNYLRALQAGLLNTIQVSFIGILLATVLGVVAGIARLSTNWLVSRVAMLYVETFRNIPLLLQLIFWYLAVFLKAPRIADSFDLFGVAFLSNRALALPSLETKDGADLWALALLGAFAIAAVAKVVQTRRQDERGKPTYPWWTASGVFVAIAAVAFLATGLPLSIDLPEAGRTSFSGGMTISPEFAALLTGLSVYTGSFIAEIVRGSIQAIPKGQTEAAAALGLTTAERMRFVILPQAMAIIIPPLTNQYLNLMKNSSLAVAVAFKDLFDVTRITANQSGQFVPLVTLVMLTYLTMSLTISAVMNGLYSRLQWRKAR